MDLQLKQTFLFKWRKYFADAEFPLAYEYTDGERDAVPAVPTEDTHCMISMLKRVRAGENLSFSIKSYGCAAGRFYSGYTSHLRKDIAEFLSCGKDEEGLDGERYKKTPELAQAAVEQLPSYQAPATRLVVKRWDKLDERDTPEVVVFFATPDVLSGLFTLYNYDERDLHANVVTPFGSGCATVIQYPYVESKKEKPRAILGMFDISARPHVPADTLSFAIPMRKLEAMIRNMDESFLITRSWEVVKGRLAHEQG